VEFPPILKSKDTSYVHEACLIIWIERGIRVLHEGMEFPTLGTSGSNTSGSAGPLRGTPPPRLPEASKLSVGETSVLACMMRLCFVFWMIICVSHSVAMLMFRCDGKLFCDQSSKLADIFLSTKKITQEPWYKFHASLVSPCGIFGTTE
jgi:hypothetical protein